MKKLIIFAPLLLLSACGYSVLDAAEDISNASSNGMEDGEKVTTKAATIGNFATLASVGPDNITFNAAESFTISATGDADVVSKLRYVLKDGKLVIGREDESWMDYKGGVANITVSAPTLDKISMVGSGDLTAPTLDNDALKISVAGSGNVDVKALKASSVKGSVAGSGNISLAGTADNAKFSIAGSGNVKATQLKSKTAKASIAGSGDIDLFASETVKASLVGSGDVNVTGGAKCKSSSVGSGELNCS